VDAVSRTIILFAKEPVAGEVKTRLSPPLAPGEAAELAAAFIEDTAVMLTGVAAERKVVACAPPEAAAALRRLVGEGFALQAQAGGDLGERMHAAFEEAFRGGARRVVIIGADSPTLPRRFIAEAFEALEKKAVVLGPALDRGYYLIGLERPIPDLFRGVRWGSGDVLQRTLEIIGREALPLHLLPLWFDVDTPADLKLLRLQVEALRLAGDASFPRATAALLARFCGERFFEGS
jgi:hypothetical protein